MPSWDDLEPVTDNAPSWDALRPVTPPPPQAPPSSPSYLGRIAELTGERWREQGGNIGNILKGVGGAAARIPTRDTPMPSISAALPGSGILEKGLNLVRLIPQVAVLEAGLAPIGAAIQTGAERLGGVSPEKSREVSNYLELATTLPLAFARTGPGVLSQALQSVGVGRPSKAAEVAARTAAMERKYPGSVGPDLPLTTSERLAGEYGDNFPREMVPLYTPPVKTGKGKGKAPKQTAPWNKLSRENAPPVSELQGRDASKLIATMGQVRQVPQTPEALLLRGLNSQDFPPPPPVEQPAGMNVLEAVDRWNPRAVAMREAIEEAERIRQSPVGREGLLRSLQALDIPPEATPPTAPPPPMKALPPAPPLAVTPSGQVVPREAPWTLGLSPNELKTSRAILAGERGGRRPIPQVGDVPPETGLQVPPAPTAAATGPVATAQSAAQAKLAKQLAKGGAKKAGKKATSPVAALEETLGIPSGTTELGMGLPIPKSVKDWTRRFLTGEEKPGAKAHGWLTDWTIFNRALGVDPATKKPIGDLVNNSILTTMQIEGKKNNAVGKTLLLSNRGKEAVLNEAENVNLMRVMEGKERPMNARVAEAADVLIPDLAQDSAIYTKEGAQILRDAVYDTKTGATIRENQWVPYRGLKNYYPHYPDPTLIVKYSADEGAKLILRDYPKMPRATAQDLATAILAEAKGESIPQSVGKGARELLQLGQPQATHLHARSPNFTYPEEFRMRPNKAIPRYNEASATELGYLLNLGPRDAKIEQALGRARASGRSDVGVAQSAWNHLRNRAVIDPLGTTTKKVVQLGKNLTTATLLGINTAVKQTSQAGMHFFGDTRMRHSLATLGKAFTKGGKREAREMGALIDDMRSQLELQNPIHWGILPKDTLLDKAVKHTGRLATVVVTKTGSIPMDTLWRTWSALASKRDFLAYQREAAKGSNKAVSMLKRFDLTPTSPLADIERAAQKLSHRTNLRADTMTIPGVFYRDTTASLLSSLQKFNISMVSKLRKEFVAPMAKALYAKDRAEAMYQAKRTAKFLAGMGITGEVIADTLTTIQGRSDDRPGGSLVEFIQGALNGDVSPETAVRRFGENLVTAGTFGALQVIQGALYAQGGAREKQGRIAGAFGGAVVGSAAEAGGHVADLLTASREPNENTGISPHDRAKSNALRALLSRVPGTRPFSGMVAPKVGELLGLPKMKTPRAKVRTEAAIERATKRRDSEAVSEWAQWYRQQQ